MKAAADAAEFGALLLQRLGRSADPPPPIRSRIERTARRAAAILAPDSPDAIAEVLGICTAEGWPVRVAGAAHGQRPEDRPVVIISTARLDGVAEHEPADLVAGVGSGIPLTGLAAHLRAAGQWLPLDPPDPGDGTLGAALALAAAGPLRAGHGTPRDMALGLEVITGDGRRLRFGGRVVKNVAGYDAVRVLVGSGGRLGVITQAFVRLRGLPRHDLTLLAPVADPAAGAELALDARDRVQCDALELIFSPALTGRTAWVIAIRVTGGDAAVRSAATRLREILPGAVDQADGSLWSSLARAEGSAQVRECATSPPSELPDRLAAIRNAPAAGWNVAVHITDGVVRAWRDDESGERLMDPPAKLSPRHESLTRHLCAAFDPAGILQPASLIDE